MTEAPPPRSALKRWGWFVGLWAASVASLAVAAGLLKLVFSLIFGLTGHA